MQCYEAREGEGAQRTIDHFITQLWATSFITNMSLIKLQILYIPLSSSGFNLTKYLGHWSLHFEIYSYIYIFISKSTAIAAVATLVEGAHGIWYTNVTFTTLISLLGPL